MLTECKFVPATALDGLAANLATLLEWSRLQDTDGIGFFFIGGATLASPRLDTGRSPMAFKVQAPARCRG